MFMSRSMGVGMDERDQGPSLHDLVVKAVHESYATDGHAVVPNWTMSTNGHRKPDLLIPSLRRIEEVETDETFDELDPSEFEDFLREGLEVWLLVPLGKLGQAHTRFRGKAHRVQAWWVNDERICFGRAEAL